jgi:hypothetical protein
MEGLRLSEPGEDGAVEPGVAADTDSAVGFAAAADAGLQCAQANMLKPRPLQLVQIAPLDFVRMGSAVDRLWIGNGCVG